MKRSIHLKKDDNYIAPTIIYYYDDNKIKKNMITLTNIKNINIIGKQHIYITYHLHMHFYT